MDKKIYYKIAKTDFEEYRCKDCGVTALRTQPINIVQDIVENKFDMICDKCLKNYEILKQKPDNKFVANGVEYIEVPCENCPGKSFKVFKQNEDNKI